MRLTVQSCICFFVVLFFTGVVFAADSDLDLNPDWKEYRTCMEDAGVDKISDLRDLEDPQGTIDTCLLEAGVDVDQIRADNKLERENARLQRQADREAARGQRQIEREANRDQRQLDREADRDQRQLDREADREQRQLDREADREQRKIDREADRDQRKIDRKADRKQRKIDRKNARKDSIKNLEICLLDIKIWEMVNPEQAASEMLKCLILADVETND